MEIRGDLLTDKENAGAALLDACKEVKTSDPVQIGSYRGYAMSVEFSAWKQEYTLLLKGQMTHRATLGTAPVSYTHLLPLMRCSKGQQARSGTLRITRKTVILGARTA